MNRRAGKNLGAADERSYTRLRCCRDFPPTFSLPGAIPMTRLAQSRRDFLRHTAALSGAALLTPGLAADGPRRAPSERLNLGVIGVAGQGDYNFNNVKHENIVALCDVDE